MISKFKIEYDDNRSNIVLAGFFSNTKFDNRTAEPRLILYLRPVHQFFSFPLLRKLVSGLWH